MLTLLLAACLHPIAGQNPPPKADPPVIKPLEPKRMDAVVVPEGSRVLLKTKGIGEITDMTVSDERVIHAFFGAGPRPFIYFDAKNLGVCQITLTDRDGKKDEVLVVVEKKAGEKKPKR